jgi:hypothetical protein
MHQVLLYSSFFIAILALFLSLYAWGRVAQFIKSTEGLEWDAIANITGDLATTKKTIQTLNNRLNGMHSPKVQEQDLMMQLIKNQESLNPNGNGKIIGG